MGRHSQLSDVGIAMGVGGTALASKAAGVVLMSNDLRRVADAVHGARLTTRVLRASVTSALLLKLLPLVLIFSLPEDAEGFLVASAVGSDLVGIVLVLAAAMSLLRAKARSPRRRAPTTTTPSRGLRCTARPRRTSALDRQKDRSRGTEPQSTSSKGRSSHPSPGRGVRA